MSRAPASKWPLFYEISHPDVVSFAVDMKIQNRLRQKIARFAKSMGVYECAQLFSAFSLPKASGYTYITAPANDGRVRFVGALCGQDDGKISRVESYVDHVQVVSKRDAARVIKFAATHPGTEPAVYLSDEVIPLFLPVYSDVFYKHEVGSLLARTSPMPVVPELSVEIPPTRSCVAYDERRVAAISRAWIRCLFNDVADPDLLNKYTEAIPDEVILGPVHTFLDKHIESKLTSLDDDSDDNRYTQIHVELFNSPQNKYGPAGYLECLVRCTRDAIEHEYPDATDKCKRICDELHANVLERMRSSEEHHVDQ
jgi:hypothetical protein